MSHVCYFYSLSQEKGQTFNDFDQKVDFWVTCKSVESSTYDVINFIHVPRTFWQSVSTTVSCVGAPGSSMKVQKVFRVLSLDCEATKRSLLVSAADRQAFISTAQRKVTFIYFIERLKSHTRATIDPINERHKKQTFLNQVNFCVPLVFSTFFNSS